MSNARARASRWITELWKLTSGDQLLAAEVLFDHIAGLEATVAEQGDRILELRDELADAQRGYDNR